MRVFRCLPDSVGHDASAPVSFMFVSWVLRTSRVKASSAAIPERSVKIPVACPTTNRFVRLSVWGIERCAQLAHGGIAVISARGVLLCGNPGVFGFDELDRVDRARCAGVFARGWCFGKTSPGSGQFAVLALRRPRCCGRSDGVPSMNHPRVVALGVVPRV